MTVSSSLAPLLLYNAMLAPMPHPPALPVNPASSGPDVLSMSSVRQDHSEQQESLGMVCSFPSQREVRQGKGFSLGLSAPAPPPPPQGNQLGWTHPSSPLCLQGTLSSVLNPILPHFLRPYLAYTELTSFSCSPEDVPSGICRIGPLFREAKGTRGNESASTSIQIPARSRYFRPKPETRGEEHLLKREIQWG